MCVLMSTSHWCSGSQSGPEHGRHVSVGAVDPQHQGQGDGHEGPGDAVGTCRQRTAFAGWLLQLFTKVQVVPGQKLKQLIQEDDGQWDLQHHHPLGRIQRGDLEDDLGKSGTSAVIFHYINLFIQRTEVLFFYLEVVPSISIACL